MIMKDLSIGSRASNDLRGPLSATISVLLKANWRPANPDTWYHPNGEEMACLSDKKFESHAIEHEVAACVDEQI